MNVASEHLRDELHVISGWIDTTYFNQDGKHCFDFSAGFLLRKLPSLEFNKYGDEYYQTWSFDSGGIKAEGSTPENALCKLAIELFKSGVLKKGIGDE